METISGFLRFRPEMRYTQSAKAVTNFRIYDNPDDTKPYKYEHRIVTWEDIAEKCNELLISGDKVYLQGYWKNRTWNKPDGEVIAIKEFTAKTIHLVLSDSEYYDIMKITDEQEEMLLHRVFEYYTNPKF